MCFPPSNPNTPYFHNETFRVMNCARRHHFIIVTKRPHLALQYLKSWPEWSPMPNVTILVTMEDQQRADERAPYARQLAAAGWKVGALCEPLLGPIDLSLTCVKCGNLTDAVCPGSSGPCNMHPRLSWVITGGESGQGARPAHPNWALSLCYQAKSAGVPFLFKQWGEWAPRSGKVWRSGTDFAALDPNCKMWPHITRLGEHGKDTRFCENCDGNQGDEAFMQRVGKKLAGRQLDGREWLEVPE